MNTFKIKPGEWEDLTKKGLRIDYIQNNKEIAQHFAISWHGRKRVLVAINADEVDGVDPLEERKHPKSDPT